MSFRDYDMLITSRATQAAMRNLGIHFKDGPIIKLSSFHHMICSSTVRGYSIEFKMWLEFHVSNITESHQNSSAIENVLFSEDMENLISSFFRERSKTTRGLWTPNQIEHIDMSIYIMRPESALKGLTAEAVLDRIGIPLLRISPDDLGSSFLETELRVFEILEHVHQWHTLVVFEAFDFFDEKCSGRDFGPDDVLCIIVRNLNSHNYKGPFFISTNRTDDVYKALLMA
jgi:hypothetical protein